MSKYEKLSINDFKDIKISIMSPEEILANSSGQVLNSETLNYKTGKAEKGGLFCERIFGPTKDWICSCGKYVHAYNHNKRCEVCGTMVTKSMVRRETFGHIELESPVVHIIFFKSNAGILSSVLNMKAKDLERIVYYTAYIVLESNESEYSKYQILTEKEYKQAINKYGSSIEFGIGAEAILRMLKDIDMDKEILSMEEELYSKKRKKPEVIKRLGIFKDMKKNNILPEWIVLKRILVSPPDLRPMIPISGGRFTTADANDLYRRLINRNVRLKKMIETKTPDIIVRHEKRLLQEAADCLFNNGKRGKAVTATNGRAFKSIADNFGGKGGIFRANILGKRVDYSGRSVIVVGPNLKLHQCGIPRRMAIELYKPFVIRELMSRGIATKTKTASKMIESKDSRIWEILDEVVKGKPVLLNRAPTLHRLGIQGFDVVLTEGNAIKLHPLVCPAFNADFDGDQMAVHVPITEQAREEVYKIIFAPNNILSPKDGRAIAVPSQDMVIGLYYLTVEIESNQLKLFENESAVRRAYDTKVIKMHERIVLRSERMKKKKVITTAGKVIFAEIFPKDFEYVNNALFEVIEDNKKIEEAIKSKVYKKPFGCKSGIKSCIDKIYEQYGQDKTVEVIDKMKEEGFKYATIAGLTISMDDVIIPEEKESIIANAENKVLYVKKLYRKGFLTEGERYSEVVKIWQKESDKLADIMMDNYTINHRFNPLYVMADSGARGSKTQIKQLSAMRGLMANTSGKIIEFPIKTCFKEGIGILDYFTSSHGARKGGVDTALKTATSGYLTRRLVDAVQSVVLQEDDCGTDKFIVAKTIISDGTEVIKLTDHILGKYIAEDVIEKKKVVIPKGKLLDNNDVKIVLDLGLKEIKIRSPKRCETKNGVCRKCYGADLSNWKPVRLGEAVGVIAAQSIGEPGTQLTMRTFHTGGVAGNDITQGLPRVEQLVEAQKPAITAAISPIDGVVSIEEVDEKVVLKVSDGEVSKKFKLPTTLKLLVNDGQSVKKGDIMTGGALNLQEAVYILGKEYVEDYITYEIIKVYVSQGVKIDTKHVDIIVRQMMKKVKIDNPGDSMYQEGEILDIEDFYEERDKLIAQNKEVPTYIQLVTGIKKIASSAKSYLSAASFEEPLKILPNAAMRGYVDKLVGLKENIIIGRLIPAGTGFKEHNNIPETEYYLK